jgi:hypothetical protein
MIIMGAIGVAKAAGGDTSVIVRSGRVSVTPQVLHPEIHALVRYYLKVLNLLACHEHCSSRWMLGRHGSA